MWYWSSVIEADVGISVDGRVSYMGTSVDRRVRDW